MIFKRFIIVSAIPFVSALSGCAETLYGAPKEMWPTLTPDQQQAAISGYNKWQSAHDHHSAVDAPYRADRERKERELENTKRVYKNITDAFTAK